MPGLVDTNILVSHFDRRFPHKRARATAFLRRGVEQGDLRIPHQALVEFIAAVTRPIGRGSGILPREEAFLQVESFLDQFPVVYPTEEVFRLAIRGFAAYRLSWFDAHIWACAEFYGLSPLFTEDFESGRRIGTVEIENPLI